MGDNAGKRRDAIFYLKDVAAFGNLPCIAYLAAHFSVKWRAIQEEHRFVSFSYLIHKPIARDDPDDGITSSLVKQYNPNVAVVMFGANDGQGITSSTGKVIPYNYTGWAEEYAKKVGYFVDILEKNNTTIFWIGVPIMKSSNLSNKMSTLNTIYEAELKNHTNAYFIPTWEALADENGKYTAYLKDANGKAKLIRTSDGVHLQYYAGYLISDDIIAKMQETMVLEKIFK